jgi:methylthioribose-1-phosphate isomerase
MGQMSLFGEWTHHLHAWLTPAQPRKQASKLAVSLLDEMAIPGVLATTAMAAMARFCQ